MTDDSRRKAQSVLYYLGKGLWKSIPVIGPIVEELVYRQFEDQLSGRSQQGVAELSEEKLPSQQEVESSFGRLEELAWEQRLAVVRGCTEVQDAVASGFGEVREWFGRIEETLLELGDRIADKEELQSKLSEWEQQRLRWRARISASQLDLLEIVPAEPTAVAELPQEFEKLYPETGLIEFRFRLHELEWLGLVARKRDQGSDWSYWRVVNGRGRASHLPAISP